MNKSVRLRAVEPEDADFLFVSDNDETSRIYSDYIAPLSRHQLVEYALTYEADPFRAGQLRLIAENEEGRKIGILDFYNISAIDSKSFVGIFITPQERGKGYGSLLLEKGKIFAKRNLSLNILAAKIHPENKISEKTFRGAGFTMITRLPEWHKVKGKLTDMLLYICKL